MTHLHFDHAGGLTKLEKGQYVSAFPNAKIITSQVEWDEMRNPNIRSKNTYWKENWEAIEHRWFLLKKSGVLEPLQWFIQADIVMDIPFYRRGRGRNVNSYGGPDANTCPPTVLWVMAYDDYPMDSLRQRKNGCHTA